MFYCIAFLCITKQYIFYCFYKHSFFNTFVAVDNRYDGPIGLAAELAGLQDDVVLARSTDDPVEEISVPTPYMKSTPSDKLFMERPGTVFLSDT